MKITIWIGRVLLAELATLHMILKNSTPAILAQTHTLARYTNLVQ